MVDPFYLAVLEASEPLDCYRLRIRFVRSTWYPAGLDATRK